MIRRHIKGIFTVFMVLVILIGLAGCQGFSAGPPKEVVAQAVKVRAQADQQMLWQQLSLQTDVSPSLSIKQVKIRKTRPVQVASKLAYEVTGTYQYKLRYPNRRKIEQSQVPFDVVLQAIPETENWQFLRIETDQEGDRRRWSWETLTGDRA